MRIPIVLALVLASIQAFAQPDVEIQNAFSRIRAQRSLFMRLDGTEIIGLEQHHILVDAFWDTVPSGGKIISRAKVVSYRDEVERQRLVGDGTNLWNVDINRNEYATSIYGSYTAKQPDTYQVALLQSMVAGSHGATVFPARLLRDIYGGLGATFKTWTPGTNASENNGVITYAVGNPPTRQVTFVLDVTGGLVSMSYLDTKGNQQVSWTLNFYSFLAPPPDWDFSFVPAGNMRPIAGR